jgi:caa(3)-type oxidase subunit IV
MSDPHTPAPTDPPIESHATPASHDPHHHEMHLGLYWGIGGVLVFFTVFTVFLSYVNFDEWFGGHSSNMVIGMIVATFKVSLVMAIFMHLKGEKSTVWRFLYFTFFFLLGLFLLTGFAIFNPIYGTLHSHH